MNNRRRRNLPAAQRHSSLFWLGAWISLAVSLAGFAQSGSNGKAASKNSAAEGKGIYDRRCASCHFSESTAQKIGPGLKGLYTRATFAGGGKVDDAGLTRWIESGGTDMPGFKDALKAEQIRALVSYIKTL